MGLKLSAISRSLACYRTVLAHQLLVSQAPARRSQELGVRHEDLQTSAGAHLVALAIGPITSLLDKVGPYPARRPGKFLDPWTLPRCLHAPVDTRYNTSR